MRSRLVLGSLAVALVVALLTAGLVVWRSEPPGRLAAAAAHAPAGTQRLSWVDWAGVRRAVGADSTQSATPEQVGTLLDAAFDRGLSPTSALTSSAEVMHERFGFSPATLEWELFTQGPGGAVEVLGLAEDTSYARIGDLLEGAGFTRPGEDETDGAVWTAGPDVLARIDSRLTPELQYVALLAEEHLILTSDRQGYLEQAVAAAVGDEPALEGLEDVLEASGAALAAAVYDGPYTCEHLAMAQADPVDEAEADALLAAAGEVDPVTGYAMAIDDGGEVRVAMSFADDEQARTNADTRAVLARGPAPGQGGGFDDRFSVADVRAEGSLLVLDLVPEPGQFVLADLASGPVLFATC